MKILRFLAEYSNAEPHARRDVVKKVEKQLSSYSPDNVTLPIVAATIYFHEKEIDSALKVS